MCHPLVRSTEILLSVRTNLKKPYEKIPTDKRGCVIRTATCARYSFCVRLRLNCAEIHCLPCVLRRIPHGARQPHLEVSKCFSPRLSFLAQPAIDVLMPAGVDLCDCQ